MTLIKHIVHAPIGVFRHAHELDKDYKIRWDSVL